MIFIFLPYITSLKTWLRKCSVNHCWYLLHTSCEIKMLMPFMHFQKPGFFSILRAVLSRLVMSYILGNDSKIFHVALNQ